jgi:hypothetical protein
MEFKGTKGEWLLNLDSNFESFVTTETHRIAEVKHYDSQIDSELLEPTLEEGKANATLIAASKNLLEALQNITASAIEGYVSFADITVAQEAINKALTIK